MKGRYKAFSLGLMFILCLPVFAQENFDIQGIGESPSKQECGRFQYIFSRTPPEIQFSVERDKNNILYFVTNNKSWFLRLFRDPDDGLAIDVVNKARYACDVETLADSQIRGTLLRPVYAADLKRDLREYAKGRFKVRVGRLDGNIPETDLEYNILFLSNKYLCRYQTIYNLEAYTYSLLDMGMYLDSITYKSSTGEGTSGFSLKNKQLTFTVPFEKDKSNYSPEDIKPIYDSLHITDFNIKTIGIEAYSSVEGPLARNIQLQEERAASIVKALQSFQKPTIATTVNASENWVEFLRDVKNTDFAALAALPKKEVKERLTGQLSTALEPVLAKHRKAFVTLSLEKIDILADQTDASLIDRFNQAIAKENLSDAEEIQLALYQRLIEGTTPPETLERLEIPVQAKYTGLLNNQAAAKTLADQRYLLISRNDLKKLEILSPNNKEVKYNLAAINILLWKYRADEVDEGKLLSDIHALEQLKIDKSLIDRMLINYYVILAENFMRDRDFPNKDRAVDAIVGKLVETSLSDNDFLSIAQFLGYYSKLDVARNLLAKRVEDIAVSEDLLYYYLNLTIINQKLTSTEDYRTVLLNAYNRNKERYCHMFAAVAEGGITFQLLDDEYLRKSYCENCAGEVPAAQN
ncbi:MAG: hypothetical protein WBG71_11100 [Leeuwenhoekiella sp.]